MGQCIEKLACEKCGSSDGLQVFEDEENGIDGFCYACKTYYKDPYNGVERDKEQPKRLAPKQKDDPLSLPLDGLSSRGLDKEVCSLYGVRVSYLQSDGKTIERSFYPDTKDGVVCGWESRQHIGSKAFLSIGDRKGFLELWGQQVAKKNNGKRLYITEGRIDCLSVYQTLTKLVDKKYSRYKPSVVSLTRGAAGAVKDVLNNREFVESFGEVILCFDNDKAGVEATKSVTKVFPLFKTIDLPLKDPNEMVMAGREKELFNELKWNPKVKRQGTVLGIPDIIEAALVRPKMGICTPWDSVTKLCYGFRPHTIHIVGAAPKIGKALDVNTLIPTPIGFRKMGGLRVGDYVYGEDGSPVCITWESGVMYGRPCYEMRFSSGEVVTCDEEHLWTVDIQGGRGTKTITTKEISKQVLSGKKYKYRVPLCKPLFGCKAYNLTIPPYTLGAWLGGGTSKQATITNFDKEVLDKIEEEGFQISHRTTVGDYGILGGFRALLVEHNLLANKHMPSICLFADEQYRWELFRGLMDTDGCALKNGSCEFTSTNRSIAEGVFKLAASLGARPTLKTGRAMLYGKDCGEKYRVCFKPSRTDTIFYIERKQQRLGLPEKTLHRGIISCEKVESVPVKCISVGNDSHLYLCTESCIPTHNSDHEYQIIHNLTYKQGKKVGVFDLENPPQKTAKKIASKQAGLDFTKPGAVYEDDLLRRKLNDLGGLAFFYDRGASREWEDIRSAMEEMHLLDGVNFFTLDPITALISRFSASEANDRLNEICTDMADFVYKFPVTLINYSHVNPKKKGSKPHEEGARVLSSEFTGSRAMEKWFNYGWGLRRDRSPDCPPEEVDISYLDLLFDRDFGNSGTTTLFFDKDDMSYLEV